MKKIEILRFTKPLKCFISVTKKSKGNEGLDLKKVPGGSSHSVAQGVEPSFRMEETLLQLFLLLERI